ncbi:MAG TPA: sulfotransferase domain-containing protein, partial [Sphingomicrobium sp.]|nr:sulfotransferase domain-containing protein [Sphingomicrobium sp.]
MRSTHPARLPDFLVVGPPRTATTWLDGVLRGHVGLPAGVKETHFFARNYGRGIDWYKDHFTQAGQSQKLGEVCAAYFENPDARERIHLHVPNCKIICTLRDPVDRLYSYYKLMRQGGKTEL